MAPRSIWIPFIPSSMNKKKVSEFGVNSPMGRAGQPVELAGTYVFLVCNEVSYISGITIYVNGGEIING